MSPPETAPWLVGVVSVPDAVEAFAATPPAARVIDLLEVRLDFFDVPEIAACAGAAARVEATGTPVLATIRLASEGGRWMRADADRLPLYRDAVTWASWVDVEASSPIAREVTALARARGRKSIVSHHDFARTPPLAELERIVAACEALGADVPKIATRVASDADRDALFALLATRAGRVCVIGMGAPELRLELPARGSRLAYGYIDASTAPGQLSAVEMDTRLAAASPSYAAKRATRARRFTA